MNAFLRYNRRGMGWALTFAIFVMASASSASWQCLDGTPCAPDCKMLHSVVARASACAVPVAPHCSHCPTASVAVQSIAQAGGSSCSCTTPHCVLRSTDRPVSSLQDRVDFPSPVAALTPLPVAVTPRATTTFSVVAPLEFFPQRFLRPHFGRAPPVLL